MKIRRQDHKLYISRGTKEEYPQLGITIAVALLYLAPFVTTWFVLVSFLICIYRVLRYNARVFAADFCILMPISVLTKFNGGVALQIYLCLIAGIVYLFRGGIRVNAAYLLLLVFANYLFLRMQMNINDFVLCLGQIFTLCVLLPEQDEKSAERAVKAFCGSLILSSYYAFALRNTYALRQMTGMASGHLWGTNVTRFCGLYGDPNYYSSFLVVGIALLLKLKDGRRLGDLQFWGEILCMTLFGIMTYSKMFFLMFLLLIGAYIVWQYWNKKVFRGVFLTVMAVILILTILKMEKSPFEVVLQRLTSARTLKELTTSRSSVIALYAKEITEDWMSVLFGKGLAAMALYRDPHNLYVEITYYIGVVGLLLIAAIYTAMMHFMIRRTINTSKQNFIAKYLVIIAVLGMYISLHGMFFQILYAELFLAYLSVLLYRKPEN